MEENDSISPSSYTIGTQTSSNVDVIKQETETDEDNIDEKLSNIFKTLGHENPNQDMKGIYYTNLTKEMKEIEINPPEDFMETLQTCEQVLRSKIKTCLDLSKNYRTMTDEKEKENKILEKRIEIIDAIKLKIETDENKKNSQNQTKVREEINKKYAESKEDLRFIMNELYPGDPNITNLLQELHTSNEKSSGYVTISDTESQLIFDLKENDIIEFNPTMPNQIKFISFS